MRRVIVESPYAGDVERNVEYARAAIRDCLLRGEAPIASHLLYTQPGVLDDDTPAERQHGIDAGLAWGSVADATVVYTDRGISRGMRYGIAAAINDGRVVEYRICGRASWRGFGRTTMADDRTIDAILRTLRKRRRDVEREDIHPDRYADRQFQLGQINGLSIALGEVRRVALRKRKAGGGNG